MTRLATCCAIMLLASGCYRRSDPGAEGEAARQETIALPQVSSADTSELQRQVQDIFDEYCVRCHGRSGGLSLKRGEAFKNLINVTSKGYSPKLRIVPGKPEESVLYHKLIGSKGYGRRMPARGGLPDAKVALIKKWIESLGRQN